MSDLTPFAHEMTDEVRRVGLAKWLSKGGRRRQEIRDAVKARAAGRCEGCGEELDFHDGRSGFGGTYMLRDESEPIVPSNLVVIHRGCIARVRSSDGEGT